jgi:hypothetical protein
LKPPPEGGVPEPDGGVPEPDGGVPEPEGGPPGPPKPPEGSVMPSLARHERSDVDRAPLAALLPDGALPEEALADEPVLELLELLLEEPPQAAMIRHAASANIE